MPFRLVSTGRRWYLVARDLDRDGWRSFRLDRITDPRPTGVRTRPADPPDPARFVAELDLDIPFTPLWPPELRARCAELSKRLAEAAATASDSVNT